LKQLAETEAAPAAVPAVAVEDEVIMDTAEQARPHKGGEPYADARAG
jgi:hypothetical protein